jgi:hypothetical protein
MCNIDFIEVVPQLRCPNYKKAAGKGRVHRLFCTLPSLKIFKVSIEFSI